MRCLKCDYSLFDIRERICPECGEPFALSSHVFDHCGVRFCCPHCDQQYYGTDLNGHLVPREFQCCRCRNRVSMHEMIVRRPLHVVTHRRYASSFPGFAGTALCILAVLGLLNSALITNEGLTLNPSILRSPLQQWPASILSQIADLVLVPLLFIGGFGLAKRRRFSRTFLLAWSMCQCANVVAYIALLMHQRAAIAPIAPLGLMNIAIYDVPFLIPVAILAITLVQPRVSAIFEAWERPPT